MADGSIIIEVKGDAGELERALKNVSRSADTLEDAVKDVASAFKKVESAADDVDGDGLEDAARDADKLDRELDDVASAFRKVENAVDDVDGDGLKDAARDADKLDRELDEAAQSAGKLGDKLGSGFTAAKGILANLASEGIQMVASGLVDLAGEAITAADSLTKFESTMDFAGFGAQEIDALTQSVQDYASKTVYDLETIANTTAQLGANGVKDFMALTEAAGNLNAVAGGNADTFKSVAMVLTQTAGAGKLTTENWNQLADAIPGASGVLQEAMKKNGAYTGDFRDAMAKGEITAEEFNQAIMELGFEEAAIEAASSTKTIEGAFGNLKATVVDGFVAALTDGGLMNGITGFINGLSNVLSNAGQYIGPAMDSIKGSIQGVKDAFANAFTGEQQAAILDFLSTFASALVALPFQVVAVNVENITTAFELLITASGAVVNFFSTTLPNAFNSAKEAVTSSVETLKNNVIKAWDNLKSSVSSTVENLKSDITKAWDNIKSAISNSLDSIKSTVKSAWDNIKSAISKALDSIKSTVKSAWDNVKSTVSSVLDNIKSTVTNVWNNIKSTITNAVNNVKSSVSSAFESIKSTISSTLNAAKSTALSVFDAIKSAITDKINAARDAVQRAIDKIKSIMHFSWSLPKLKLPHISISGGFSINPPSAPKFSISWYKKGGVMMDPTIFGMAGSTLLGGGEAGPEAIAPISVLQDYVSEAVTEAMAEFTSELKTAVEEETAAISAALGNRANPEGGSVNNSYGGTTINIYVDGTKAETPQQARDLGRELGGELNREMRRRGLVPA